MSASERAGAAAAAVFFPQENVGCLVDTGVSFCPAAIAPPMNFPFFAAIGRRAGAGAELAAAAPAEGAAAALARAMSVGSACGFEGPSGGLFGISAVKPKAAARDWSKAGTCPTLGGSSPGTPMAASTERSSRSATASSSEIGASTPAPRPLLDAARTSANSSPEMRRAVPVRASRVASSSSMWDFVFSISSRTFSATCESAIRSSS
mmetsp:Transcript_148551/g.360579  ORF Transcript_148551/g.360579 Transcript_148551/m.360579 type:complete len:207 (-) Transcript_148551:1717-2337(-)